MAQHSIMPLIKEIVQHGRWPEWTQGEAAKEVVVAEVEAEMVEEVEVEEDHDQQSSIMG